MLQKYKLQILLAIALISLGRVVTKAQEDIEPALDEDTNDIDDVELNTISYDFEDKLEKLYNIQELMKTNLEKLTAEITENHKEITKLRQLVDTKVNSVPAAVVPSDQEKLAPPNVLEVKCSDGRLPQNCYEVNECQSHIYSISVQNFSQQPFPVACDLKTEDGGWTIIQRRFDGSVDFFRNWTEYVDGFGDVDGEFFIGLEKLHALTSHGEPQELFVQMEDFEGERRYAKYKTFKVAGNDTDYKLSVGEFSGDAGDSFSWHNGQKFSTWDRDNDESNDRNCADKWKGAGWYRTCYYNNLNGQYLSGKLSKSKGGRGIAWNTFRGYDYSLKFVQMMIRPRQD